MKNRCGFFSQVTDRISPVNKDIVLRNQFPQRITVQEEAAEIFYLIDDFNKKNRDFFKEQISRCRYVRSKNLVIKNVLGGIRNWAKKINECEKIFYTIANSCPIEGVFESLSYFQLCMLVPSKEYSEPNVILSLQNVLSSNQKLKKTVELLTDVWQKFDKINDLQETDAKMSQFIVKYYNQIKLSKIFILDYLNVAGCLEELAPIVGEAAKKLFYKIDLCVELSTPQDFANAIKFFVEVKNDMLKMAAITKKIAGPQVNEADYTASTDGGYSRLTDEEKCQFNQFLIKWKNWQKAFEIIDMCKMLDEEQQKHFDVLFKSIYCNLNSFQPRTTDTSRATLKRKLPYEFSVFNPSKKQKPKLNLFEPRLTRSKSRETGEELKSLKF